MKKSVEANLLKTLLDWCKQMTLGYQNVNVVNFTTSWRNGLAFCALMHRFNPALIDFASLSKDNVLENNRLAFEAGETLGVPALLDPEDMIVMAIPDKIAVVTYLSTVYCRLKDRKPMGGPNVVAATAPKRPSIVPTRRQSKVVTQKEGAVAVEAMDVCEHCNERVHLIERFWIGPHLYHRGCYLKNSAAISRKSISQEGTILPLAGTMATPGETELRMDAMRRNSTLLSEMTRSGNYPPPVSSFNAINEAAGDQHLRLNFRNPPSQVPMYPPAAQQPSQVRTTSSSELRATPVASTSGSFVASRLYSRQVPGLGVQQAPQPAIPKSAIPSSATLSPVVEDQQPVWTQQVAPTKPKQTPLVQQPPSISVISKLPVRTPQPVIQRVPVTQPAPAVAITVPVQTKEVTEQPKSPPTIAVVPTPTVAVTTPIPTAEPDDSVLSGDTTSFVKSDSFKRKTAKAIAAQFEKQRLVRNGTPTDLLATTPATTKQPQPSPAAVCNPPEPPKPAQAPPAVSEPLVVTVPVSSSSTSAASSITSSMTPSPAPSDSSTSTGEKPKKHHHKHREHKEDDGEHKHKHKHRHTKEDSELASPLTPAASSPSPSAVSSTDSGASIKDSSELLLTPPSGSSTSSIASSIASTTKQPQVITTLPAKQTPIPKTVVAPPVAQPAVVKTTTATSAPADATTAKATPAKTSNVTPGPSLPDTKQKGEAKPSAPVQAKQPPKSQGLITTTPVSSTKPQQPSKAQSTTPPVVPAVSTTLPLTKPAAPSSAVATPGVTKTKPLSTPTPVPAVTVPTPQEPVKAPKSPAPTATARVTKPPAPPSEPVETVPGKVEESGTPDQEPSDKKEPHGRVRFSETIDLVHIQRPESEQQTYQISSSEDEEGNTFPIVTRRQDVEEEPPKPREEEHRTPSDEEENPFMAYEKPNRNVPGDGLAAFGSDEMEDVAAMSRRLESLAAKLDQTAVKQPAKSCLKNPCQPMETWPVSPKVDVNPFKDFGHDDDNEDEEAPLPLQKVPVKPPRGKIAERKVSDNVFDESAVTLEVRRSRDDSNPFASDLKDPFDDETTADEQKSKRVIPKPNIEPPAKSPNSGEDEANLRVGASGQPLHVVHIEELESNDSDQPKEDLDEYDELRLDAIKERLFELENLGTDIEDRMRSAKTEDLEAMSEFVLLVNERDRLVSEEYQLVLRKELRELQARANMAQYQLRDLSDRMELMPPSKERKAIEALFHTVAQEFEQTMKQRSQTSILLEEAKQREQEQIDALDSLVSSHGGDKQRMSEPAGFVQTLKRLVSRTSQS